MEVKLGSSFFGTKLGNCCDLLTGPTSPTCPNAHPFLSSPAPTNAVSHTERVRPGPHKIALASDKFILPAFASIPFCVCCFCPSLSCPAFFFPCLLLQDTLSLSFCPKAPFFWGVATLHTSPSPLVTISDQCRKQHPVAGVTLLHSNTAFPAVPASRPPSNPSSSWPCMHPLTPTSNNTLLHTSTTRPCYRNSGGRHPDHSALLSALIPEGGHLFFSGLSFLLILEGGNLLFWLSILSAVIYFWHLVKCFLSALNSCCSFLVFPLLLICFHGL